MPDLMNKLEKRLVKNGAQYMVASEISWADIQVYYFCFEVRDMIDVSQWNRIDTLAKHVSEIPRIKEWIKFRPISSI